MIARLRKNLPHALPAALTQSGATRIRDDDLYEAYLFTLVLETARTLGYHVELIDGATGAPATSFRLRRGPGRVYSRQPFTYALLIAHNGIELELHTGVKIEGKSKVSHEADVLLMNHTVHRDHTSTPYRKAPVGAPIIDDPKSAKAVMTIEAKYYTKNIDLGLARAFLGLRSDLSPKALPVFVCTLAGASVRRLVASAKNVDYDWGVLPYRMGEHNFRSLISRLLRRINELA